MTRLNLPPMPGEGMTLSTCADRWLREAYEERDRQIAKALRERAEWHRAQERVAVRDYQHSDQAAECDFLADEIDPDTGDTKERDYDQERRNLGDPRP